MCEILGIHKTRTTVLHPQSDRMVEQMNRTLIKHLSMVVSEDQRDWDQCLYLFLMERYDIKADRGGNQPGDLVWLHNPRRRQEYSPKLHISWEGPYAVVTRLKTMM